MFATASDARIPRAGIRKAALLAIAPVLGFVSFSAAAQSMTPQQFVAACQSSLSNTVYLRESVKLQGSFPGESHNSATACNVQLAAGASFELDTITLNFAGPLTVQGGYSSKFAAQKATVNAPSIALRMTGASNEVMMNESRLFAGSGDLAIGFGLYGKFEMVNSGGWTRGGLTAAGALRVTSSTYFSGTMSNSGMEGGRGIFLRMNAGESGWKIEKSVLNVSNFTFGGANPYTTGPLSISSLAQKVIVEISETNVRFASDAITMRLSGAESSLLLKQVSSLTGGQAVYLGTPGEKGVTLIENSMFRGNPSVDVVSGVSGATAVTNSPGALYAQQRISVSTGAGGSCVVTPVSSLSAPQVDACR
jgi:hypothetical protein